MKKSESLCCVMPVTANQELIFLLLAVGNESASVQDPPCRWILDNKCVKGYKTSRQKKLQEREKNMRQHCFIHPKGVMAKYCE